jgi:hypothetical protein
MTLILGLYDSEIMIEYKFLNSSEVWIFIYELKTDIHR